MTPKLFFQPKAKRSRLRLRERGFWHCGQTEAYCYAQEIYQANHYICLRSYGITRRYLFPEEKERKSQKNRGSNEMKIDIRFGEYTLAVALSQEVIVRKSTRFIMNICPAMQAFY